MNSAKRSTTISQPKWFSKYFLQKSAKTAAAESPDIVANILKSPLLEGLPASGMLREMLMQLLYSTEVEYDGKTLKLPTPTAAPNSFYRRFAHAALGARADDILKAPRGVVKSLRDDVSRKVATDLLGVSENDWEETRENPFTLPNILAALYIQQTGADAAIDTLESHIRRKGMMHPDMARERMEEMVSIYRAVAHEAVDPDAFSKNYYGMSPKDVVQGYLLSYDRGELDGVLDPNAEVAEAGKVLRNQLKDDFRFYAMMRGTGLATGSPYEISESLEGLFGYDPVAAHGKENAYGMFEGMVATALSTGMNLDEVGPVLKDSMVRAQSVPEAMWMTQIKVLSERMRRDAGGGNMDPDYAERLSDALYEYSPSVTLVGGAYRSLTNQGVAPEDALNKVRGVVKASGGDHGKLRKAVGALTREDPYALMNSPESSMAIQDPKLLQLTYELMQDRAASTAARYMDDPHFVDLARKGRLTQTDIARTYDDMIRQDPNNTANYAKRKSIAIGRLGNMYGSGASRAMAPYGDPARAAELFKNRAHAMESMDVASDAFKESPTVLNKLLLDKEDQGGSE